MSVEAKVMCLLRGDDEDQQLLGMFGFVLFCFVFCFLFCFFVLLFFLRLQLHVCSTCPFAHPPLPFFPPPPLLHPFPYHHLPLPPPPSAAIPIFTPTALLFRCSWLSLLQLCSLCIYHFCLSFLWSVCISLPCGSVSRSRSKAVP